MVRVSVVIVTYNGEPWIRRNLLSLRKSEAFSRVIVVDNASTDRTVEILRSEFPEVALIASPVNLGFGGGNNLGIAKAIELASEYTFLLNQDAEVTATTIAELLQFMDRNPNFGVASPLHCSPDLEHLDRKTYRGYLQTFAADFLCDAALGRTASFYRVRGINAAAWFIRTSVFAKTGGFDPIFFMYGEDDDLIARFAQHDVPFALLVESRVIHFRETAAPTSASGFWRDVRRDAMRSRSGLIALIKRAEYSAPHMLLTLIAHGMLRPIADFLVERNLRNLFSSLRAAFGLLVEFRRIQRHARLCGTPGAHFLDPQELKSTT